MDIGKLNVDGEWIELVAEDERFGSLKVKVVPNPFDSLSDVAINDISGYVKRLVADWNLESSGKPVPCTPENKSKYLPIIAGWRVKNPKYSDKNLFYKSIGSEIIAFSQNIENFTKN